MKNPKKREYTVICLAKERTPEEEAAFRKRVAIQKGVIYRNQMKRLYGETEDTYWLERCSVRKVTAPYSGQAKEIKEWKQDVLNAAKFTAYPYSTL